MSVRIRVKGVYSGTETTHNAGVRASAANIPPELFERILFFFTFRDRDPVKIRHPKELTPCALTCKYWARECRKKIFEFITLRSREDVETLFRFAQEGGDSSLSIARCLQRLKLEYTFPGQPWIHLIFLRDKTVLPYTSVSDLLIHSADSDAAKETSQRVLRGVTLRSVHQLLPRTLPVVLSQTQSFDVKGIHLQRFEDLIAATHTIVCRTNSIGCENTTWDRFDSEMSATERNRWMLQDFRVTNCTDPWLFLRAVVSVRPRSPKKPPKYRPYVDATEYRKLEDIVQFITKSCVSYRRKGSGDDEEGGTPLVRENCGHFQFGTEATFIDESEYTVLFNFCVCSTTLTQHQGSAAYRIKLECAKFPCCIPDFMFMISPKGRVKNIVVVFKTNHVAWPDTFISDPSMVDFPWGPLDEMVTKLHKDFESFVIFILTTREIMCEFSKTIQEAMSGVCGANKLQLWYPEDVYKQVGWTQLGAVSDE